MDPFPHGSANLALLDLDPRTGMRISGLSKSIFSHVGVFL